jgi:hypothetical protein
MDGYLPLRSQIVEDYPRSRDFFTNREYRALTVYARLKPGITLEQAQAEMSAVARRMEAQYPATDQGIGIRVVPEPLARPIPLRFVAEVAPLVRFFLLLLAALVLLLACIQSLEPNMPVADLQTMRRSLRGAHGFLIFRVGAAQAGALGVLGLMLAIVGVYGVVSYGAAQRTREIGIRMALGATPQGILQMILRRGAWMVVSGIIAGLAGAAALTRLLARFLLLVSPTDPLTFVVVTFLLGLVALWACYVPARRAMRVEPIEALRHE